MISRRKLYAAGEPLGECVTRKEAGRIVYGGGGGGQSSSSMPMIPTELKPLATAYTDKAIAYGNTPWQAYTGQRNADLTGTQNLGIGMVQQRALGGNQTMDNAEGALNGFIQGGKTNPYLDSMVQKAQSSVADQFNTMVKPQIETAGVQSGSFGNEGLQQRMAMQQKAAAGQMSDIATSMYGNAYNTDQANKMQAIGMAPTFGDAAYKDAAQLLNVGGLQQDQNQSNLDFRFNQFQDQQNYPLKQMQAMSGVIGQNMGTKTESSGGGK